MVRFLRITTLGVGLIGCSPATEPASIDQAVQTIQPVQVPAAESSPPKSVGTPVVAEPAAKPDFEVAVADLVAGHTPSVESGTSAWVHYRAGRFVDAQREFALASLHDRASWKHPFNFACASARVDDEPRARAGVREALARDFAAAGKKAGKDEDLARYRDSKWFVAALATTAPTKPATKTTSETANAMYVTKPAPEQATALAKGVATPIAKATLGRLRKQLAARHGVEPQVRGSLSISSEGADVGFLVYDFTFTQVCKAESDRESRADCMEDLQPSDSTHSELGNQTKCVEQYLVRAELGGEPALGESLALEVACAPNQVRRLDAIDLDGDGQLEVVVDTIAITKTVDVEGVDAAYNRARHLLIARLDGSIQYQLAIQADAELPFSTISRIFGHDVDSDGHLDLIEQSLVATDLLEWECEPAQIETDFWPSCIELPEPTTVTLRYDASADTWLRPS